MSLRRPRWNPVWVTLADACSSGAPHFFARARATSDRDLVIWGNLPLAAVPHAGTWRCAVPARSNNPSPRPDADRASAPAAPLTRGQLACLPRSCRRIVGSCRATAVACKHHGLQVLRLKTVDASTLLFVALRALAVLRTGRSCHRHHGLAQSRTWSCYIAPARQRCAAPRPAARAASASSYPDSSCPRVLGL